METKKVKLASGFEAVIKEMSVDDIDYCSDIIVAKFDENNIVQSVGNLSKARTAWLRKGVASCDDKLLKSMTDDDKAELMMMVQEFQKLGEGNPSS